MSPCFLRQGLARLARFVGHSVPGVSTCPALDYKQVPGFVLQVLGDQTLVLMFAQQVLHPLNHAPCSPKVAGLSFMVVKKCWTPRLAQHGAAMLTEQSALAACRRMKQNHSEELWNCLLPHRVGAQGLPRNSSVPP